VTAVRSSGPWQGPAVYIQNYHPIQTLPFFCGFLLVSGYVVMMTALHQIAEDRHKTLTLIAVIFTAIFATLIFFNYINQTTFVPALARGYSPQFDPAITTFSLANPLSLCWAIEMWGYAFLGVATMLAAPIFNRNRLERTVAALMILNGVMSIAGGVISAWNLGWVLTTPGIANYMVWNVLVLALSILVIVSLRRRQKETATATGQPAVMLRRLKKEPRE
ncbi:MAG: DUF4386 family protein, partial [Anaerolineae bacterium]|nr:DUF4386 family protein [Anaerolineae bacterium]